MTDYDFRALNDKEFEVLAIDLLSKRDGRKYERFKPGKDAGVDGRFFNSNGKEVVLQCKHWVFSPLETLIKNLQKIELPKINKINPEKYILIISHPLSRNDKTQIFNVLSPFIKSPADILGREDLNDLLSKHADIELRHYKLWITSSNVLRGLLNKPILDRSTDILKEVQTNAHIYVPTANHDKALKKLEDLGTVIITGPAGIGKTTLAEHLSLNYVAQGFSFIAISEEIREAEAVFQADELQLFYFDDFLGRNYLEALSGHEGAHIVQFIKRVVRDKRKKFILTSRTTILNQGKILIDVFQNNNLERNEFEISFESFSDIDKARILYNHIWHSSLDARFIDEIYAEKRYRQIISHQNYNPRIIRYITNSDHLSDCAPAHYWDHAKSLLDNPATVWKNPFEAQHDDFGRALILLTTLTGRAIAEEELNESYARFIAHSDAKGIQGRRDFMQTLQHLVGSMLSRTMIASREPYINLFNPSIGDYVLRRYASDTPSLRAAFCSLRSTSSLQTLENLERNELISPATKKAVLDSILDNARLSAYVGYTPEYISLALVGLSLAFDAEALVDEKYISDAVFVARSPCPHIFSDVAEIINWLFRKDRLPQEDVIIFIDGACQQHPNSRELALLAKIVTSVSREVKPILWSKIEAAALDFFSEAVHDEFPVDKVFESVDPNSLYEAELNLTRMIEDEFSNLGIPLSDSTIESIVDTFDISERRREYFQPEPDDDRPRGQSFSAPEVDAIDDLFDRSR